MKKLLLAVLFTVSFLPILGLQQVFAVDGDLYVSSRFTDEVMRFNGATGAFIDDFVSAESGGLDEPNGLAFGPDGHLYVASRLTDEVLRYDKVTGNFIDEFVPVSGNGGMDAPFDLVFKPIAAPPVGGEPLPIESTSLLLAGAQTPIAWMMYAFSALGIGAFLFTRNPNNVRNVKVILQDYLDRFSKTG